MKNNKKNKVKVDRKKNVRKSLKGLWGKTGAPPKKTKWPSRPFTMKTLFAMNQNQCKLSLYTKVNDGLGKTIFPLAPLHQPGGKVGRPKSRFVLAEYYDSATMVLAPPVRRKSVVVKKVRKRRTPHTIDAPPAPVAVVETPTETPTAPATIVIPVEMAPLGTDTAVEINQPVIG